MMRIHRLGVVHDRFIISCIPHTCPHRRGGGGGSCSGAPAPRCRLPRDRPGGAESHWGRVWTTYELAPYPIEFGAEFIHGAQVFTWEFLHQFGLTSLPDAPNEAFSVSYHHRLHTAQTAATIPSLALLDSYPALAETWSTQQHPDTQLRAVLEAWVAQAQAQVSPDIWRLVNHLVAPREGCDLDRLGVYGLAESSAA